MLDIDEKRRYEALIAKQSAEADEISWRLLTAQKFGHLMVKAYMALKSYSVDYQKLRSYELWVSLLPMSGPVDKRAREAISRWMIEIEHDIDAAIRRKHIKQVDLH